MAVLKLSAPWITYYRELCALFHEDQQVHVVFDEDACEIKLYVDDQRKASALETLLPEEKAFGNITVKITVIPANVRTSPRLYLNADNEAYDYNLFYDAFNGNPALRCISTVKGVFGLNATYLLFKKCVVQYFNDNIGDYNGVCSTLYQDIAKDVFGPLDRVFYCTAVDDQNDCFQF